MSETETKAEGQKAKTSKLVIASAMLVILALFYVSLAIPMEARFASVMIGVVLACVGIFLGTAGLYQIQKSNGKLGGRILAIFVIVVNVVLVILLWVALHGSQARRDLAYRAVCSENLKWLGKAMLLYDGDGVEYPTADRWCDLLVIYMESRPELFVCEGSDAKIGESSYAFNKNLAGKKRWEIPRDTVVLFETNLCKDPSGRQELLGNRDWHKDTTPHRGPFEWVKKYSASEKVYKRCWNQFGGPEILTTENHKGKGCHILFHDSHVEFVERERIGELKWDVEQKQ